MSSSITTRPAGHLPDGSPITAYTLAVASGHRLSVLDLGGIVTELQAPDAAGRWGNVLLGLASLDDHWARNRNFGGLVGRYANRIAGGRFTLDGQLHELPRNDGPNTLHGGPDGFCARRWAVQPLPPGEDDSAAVELHLHSPHGDQGFPGALDLRVRYTLAPHGEWRIDYQARCDRPTVLNLTHHAYWNLAGQGSATGQRLRLAARRYAPVDAQRIPAGLAPVEGTPFDFRDGRLIDLHLRSDHEQMRRGRGYDHFFEIDRSPGGGLAFAARLEDEMSGRWLEVETTEPGLQLYTGNFLDGTLPGANGQMLRQGDGICLETQHVADAPNQAGAGGTRLDPGQEFRSTTLYRLGRRA
jgi:aldose 1-epimerase